MNIADLLKNETANIHLTVTATDLAEFAETIVKKTIEQTKNTQSEQLIPLDKLTDYATKRTFCNWEKKGYLIPVRIGNKNFYKQSDLQAIGIIVNR